MATRIGVIKSISQGANVIATAKDGTQRVLKVGDEIFLGETIQTTDFDSKVVITANDGKDIAIIGKDTLNLDKSVAHNESFGDDSVADVSAIQKALLDGANITDLEETAAGGNQGGNAGGDGVSLGAASFEEGGHYSNINENYRNLTDANKAFQTPENSIGGYNDGNDAGNATPVAPVIPPISVDIKTLTDDFGTITGDYSLDAPSVPRTNDATPTISGTVEPTAVRAVVSVLDKDGHEVFTKTLNPSDYADGKFKFTTDELSVDGKHDGDYKVKVVATGIDGNTATDTGSFVLDTVAKITINVETEMSLVKESEMSSGLKGNFWFNHIYEEGVRGTELRPYAFNNTTYAHNGMKQNDFVEYYMNNTKPWASFKAKELNFQQGKGGDRDNVDSDAGTVSGLDGAHNKIGTVDLDGNVVTPNNEWVAPNFKALEYFIDNAKGSDIHIVRDAPNGKNTTAGAMVNLKGTMYLEPGDYKFDAKGTDDSVRFKVDGVTMVDYDTIHSGNRATVTTLHVDKAGYYDFDMSYANYIFWGKLKLTVSKDGGPESILGSEASGIKLNSTDFDSYVDTVTRNVYKVTQKITGTVDNVEDGQIVTVTSSTGESHTAKVVDGKYEVEFRTSDPKATYTAKVSDLVGNEAQASSAKINVATDLIDAIDNDASIASANTNTGINDATKYYKFTTDDIAQTDKFSTNAPLPVLSDKTPTFTGSIDSSATKAIITVLDKNGHEVFTKELSQSEFANGKFEVTSDSLEDGNYKIKATAIFENGENKTSSTVVSDFVVDKTPVTIENIKIIENDNEGLHHTINFNLKNYEDGDKIESIKVVTADGNTNIISVGTTKPTNGVLSFEYDHKIKLGDKIEVEMTDKAGTKHTHVNEILVPTMTQFENGNDTTTNANNRSAEKLWGTMEMSEDGFRADGSRIVSNDAIPYLRAVIPEDTTAGNASDNQTVSEFLNSGRGIAWGTGDVRFVATNVDTGVSKDLLSQAIEKPIGNVTPDHYNRLTGYNNRLDAAGKMADGVYKISIDGKYQGGDELLYNSIKFTIDATAATINESKLHYDAAANKTTWSGNLSENGVGASYTLREHFEEAVKGIALKDSITLRGADGHIITANSVTLDDNGNFEAVFNGDVKASDVYLQISDIAKNTIVDAKNNNNNNVITTSEGNDIINVGNGDNVIHAGRGENEIRTGNGNNVIITGDNNDFITTGSGNDYIDAGRSGYTGMNKGDIVNAGAGDDKVVFTFDNPRAALSQSLDGGTGTDTLIMRPVAKDGTIDFDKIDNKGLNNAIKSFEEIQLGMDEHGNDNQAVKLLNLKADNVFSITDDVNTILKISGDNKDSVSLKGFTEAANQNGVEAGYTRYEGQTSSATPTTIYIDVDNDINKQLV
ncbi:retention module-containing protein [Campylobacter concisus]|uniref:retention module-containing protein n=1 Tax=Campylobacter concisus TaxID=199 RepID=UPI00122C9C0C|nr:retention module-containing protein [Campylobacter concisus]